MEIFLTEKRKTNGLRFFFYNLGFARENETLISFSFSSFLFGTNCTFALQIFYCAYFIPFLFFLRKRAKFTLLLWYIILIYPLLYYRVISTLVITKVFKNILILTKSHHIIKNIFLKSKKKTLSHNPLNHKNSFTYCISSSHISQSFKSDGLNQEKE